MKLPANWRSRHTNELARWLDNGQLDDDDLDLVLAELNERDRQADANGGLTNGLAPER